MSPSDEDFVAFAEPDIGKLEVDAMTNAVKSGWLTTGQNTAAFELEFGQYVGGGRIALAVNSATAGLHLALESLGVGPGDEVIVPVWTFTATAEVVRYLGARPVFVDVDARTLNVDLNAVEGAISESTKVIMPVHFAGLAVDMRPLWKLAAQKGLAVVEDAAHAIPCTTGGMTVGAGESDAVVFSFYATKPITTGEGGMVVVADPERADRIRTMRLHGISRDVFDRYSSRHASWRYEVVAPGYKYNMPDPAAAMGRVQLARAHEMGRRRSEIAQAYNEAFQDLPIQLPAMPAHDDVHSWHLYVIRVGRTNPSSRDRFVESMSSRGVGTSVHFIPLHLHPYWRDSCQTSAEDFPVASAEFERVISLPIYSAMSQEKTQKVISAVRGSIT